MKTITTFVIAILMFGFLFLVLPEKGYAGMDMMPIEMGCLQIFSDEDGFRCCEFELGISCALAIGDEVIGEFEGQTCNEQTGLCNGFEPNNDVTRNVPTISEWGLIATAGVLGIMGFIVMRRRKATA